MLLPLLLLALVAVQVEPTILEVEPGGSGQVKLTLNSNELKPLTVSVEAYAEHLTVEPGEASVEVKPLGSTSLNFTVKAPPGSYPGLKLVRFNVKAGGDTLTATAIVKVARPQVTVQTVQPIAKWWPVAVTALTALILIPLLIRRRRSGVFKASPALTSIRPTSTDVDGRHTHITCYSTCCSTGTSRAVTSTSGAGVLKLLPGSVWRLGEWPR